MNQNGHQNLPQTEAIVAETEYAGPATEIKILTYNIFIRPPPIKNNADDFKDERLILFFEKMHSYHVICLQEMFGFMSHRKSRLINHAFKSGFKYWVASPKPSFFSKALIDGGLLILSRFPIVSSRFQEFPFGIFTDALSLKGILYAEILIPGADPLHIFTSHTQASYFYDGPQILRMSYYTRLEQLFICREFIEKCLRKNMKSLKETVIITGDFNVNGKCPDLLDGLLGEDVLYAQVCNLRAI
eukprot:TRINITY_DN2751_c0_g1_i2.p1 TRINITY_DN2751_c0_g1~~TRINITY_DN2751_c0_g1_i2.p1  ORF type:complete len:244 (+),score=35.90 TRINITY_DN2751_c0_g1_i2:61-792(+)